MSQSVRLQSVYLILKHSKCLSHQPSITTEQSCETEPFDMVTTKKNSRGFSYVPIIWLTKEMLNMCEQPHPLFYLCSGLFQKSFSYKKCVVKVSFTLSETMLNNIISHHFHRAFWISPPSYPRTWGPKCNHLLVLFRQFWGCWATK